jgi:hypothetical protein
MKVAENIFLYDGIERPERPNIYCIFTDGQWVLDIESYKFDKKNNIKRSYQSEISSGFISETGIKLSCIASDIQAIKNNYEFSVISGKDYVVIEDFNNDYYEITLDDAKKVIKELSDYIIYINNINKELHDKLSKAITVDEINAIFWPQ